jgi:hypothetical protein
MSKIKVGQGSFLQDSAVMRQAFPRPKEGDTVKYLYSTAGAAYHGYLVEVVEKSDAHIKFRGIDKATGKSADVERTVSLRHTFDVWPAAPSTDLSNWSPDNNCAILLLSDTYVRGETPEQRKEDLVLALEDGGNKWPRGSGDAVLRERERELRRLVNDLLATMEDDRKGSFRDRLDSLLPDGSDL